MKLRIILFTCFLILIYSCEKESALEKYYYQEGNFSGSIYDGLDTLGHYSLFLQAVEMTGFANQLKNTLVTVIAPSDEAFKGYIAKHGYTDLSSVPKKVLEDLVGHHIITWPHTPGSLKENPEFFKRKSNMAPSTVKKYDAITNADKVMKKDVKYLQFFYPEMLNYYGGTKNDYKILTGTDLSPTTGMNVYNVPVDTIAAYGNGWVYYVDQVVEPQENLDDWLMNSSEYSFFSFLFNRFNRYSSETPIRKRSNLYQYDPGYSIDMNLDYEPVYYNTLGGTGGSGEYQLNSKSAFTVFAPKNEAIESFIDQTFTDYPGFKDSIRVIDFNSQNNLHIQKIVRAMLFPYMYISQAVFPSNILSDHGVTGFDRTVLKFKEQDILEYKLCSNGFGYGVNKYEVPRTFKSVLKPIYTTPDFKCFAAIIELTKSTAFLNSLDDNFTVFIPTDSAFKNANIILVDANTAVNEYAQTADPLLGRSYFLDISGTEAKTLNPQILFELVFSHVFTEKITPSSQKQFFVNTMDRYVGITKDSVWSGGNVYNMLNTRITPHIIKSFPESSFDNGSVYVIDEIVKSPALSIGNIIKINPDFSRFRALCENAGLFTSSGKLNIQGRYPTVFIPTNAAIDQFIADGKLPSDELLLQNLLTYAFVNRTIFTTETISETIESLSRDEQLSTEFKVIYRKTDINGANGDLKVKGSNNSTYVNVIDGANSNIICTDGIIHQIDGVLN